MAFRGDMHQTGTMAYLKPPWFVRTLVNRIAMATGVGHSETLTVTRRTNKETQQIPVVVPAVDGVKYLVSTRGESDWVRNIRADPRVLLGQVQLRRHRGSGAAAGTGDRGLPSAGRQGGGGLLPRSAR